MENKNYVDLLETVQKNVGCEYISDLKMPCYTRAALQEAINIPDDQFSLEQWNEGFSYILNKRFEAENISEAKKNAYKMFMENSNIT